MIAVAIKGLLGRKIRAVLTAFAIVLGVAMISGTFVLTDTIQKAFDNVFASSFGQTSVVISGKEIVKGATSQPTVPATLLPKVRALPGVAAASGNFLFDEVKLINGKGKQIGGSGHGGSPAFGFGVDPGLPRFNPLTLTSGKWAAGPHQIVIDQATADKKHYRVGDSIGAKADGPIKQYTITGTAKISGASIGGATMAAFDVSTAQAILNKRGRFDSISVAAGSGVADARLAAEIRPLLPTTVRVRTADQQAKAQSKDVSSGTSTFKIFLLAFAGIALFVGAFVIFNTISITVAQRAREFATLRTLGASRRQVLRSVLLESFLIGLIASLIGLVLGVGLAKGLDALFKAIGISLPQAGTVLAARTVIVSLLVGTVVTLISGLVPAVRATRVPAITAVREGAVLPKSRLAPLRPYVAGVVIALGVATIALGLFGSSGTKGVLIPLGAGTVLLFVGIGMMSSHLVRPLAAIVGQPARRFGGTPGRLAAENSLRNPARTAGTAAALMIGLALVTFVATLGSGIRASDEDALKKQVKADYVVTPGKSSEQGLFPTAAGDALAKTPGVTIASSVRSDQARIFRKSTEVAGVDGPTIARVYHFIWKQGSDSLLPTLGNGAIVDKGYAKTHHLRIGSPLGIETSTGSKRTLVVRGIYHPPQVDVLFPGIVISKALFDRTFPRPDNQFTFVDVRGGPSDTATATLKHALAPFPDTKLQTQPVWVKARAGEIKTVLDIFYVLLALSVIVSLFGMVNTLVLTVFERTRELGMLRAVGMTRRQVRRMVRHESVITALIGAALGLPLGIFLAALVTSALANQGLGFHLPLISLLIFGAIAVLAGIAAAIWPARRASGLRILAALQYE